MKIIYLLPGAGRAGGVKVICEHVAGLCGRGHDASVWGVSGDLNWFGRPVPHRKFRSTDELGAALRAATPKVMVATFWSSNSWLVPNLLPGDRAFALTQDLDAEVYSGVKSSAPYRLPIHYLTESDFIRDELLVKHGTASTQISLGVCPQTFRNLPFLRDPYQILTPCRTTSAGPKGLKGWDIAVEVLKRVAKLEPRASVATFGMEPDPRLDFVAHTHHQSPTDKRLRELYSRAGLFLSTSRREGFNLTALEAMCCQTPVVCTDAGGNREFCKHENTALVHPAADVEGLARSVVRVMSDRALAASLAASGLRESQRYRWPAVIDRLEALFAGSTPAK